MRIFRILGLKTALGWGPPTGSGLGPLAVSAPWLQPRHKPARTPRDGAEMSFFRQASYVEARFQRGLSRLVRKLDSYIVLVQESVRKIACYAQVRKYATFPCVDVEEYVLPSLEIISVHRGPAFEPKF